MLSFLKSVYRHYKLPFVGPLAGANLACLLPFAAALIGPLYLAGNLNLGIVILLGGFLLTGQVVAVSGRVLDHRFQGLKREKGSVLRAWREGWSEGLVVAVLLIGGFTLLFSSLPFYVAQGTPFAWFSLATLAVGSLLLLGGLPYYLPVRRREGLGLIAAFGRSFQLMNAKPGLAAASLGLGALALAVNFGSLGLFPGFAGLAAFHQGVYDRAVED